MRARPFVELKILSENIGTTEKLLDYKLPLFIRIMWMATAIIVAAAAIASLFSNDCVMKGEIIYFYCRESFQFRSIWHMLVLCLSWVRWFDYRNVSSQRHMKANIFRIVLSKAT